MNIKDLKSIIREIAVDEMARIPSKFQLTPDWETAFETLPDNQKKSVRFSRIINYMQEQGEPVLQKDVAFDAFNSEDPASVNPQFRALLAAGVIENVGLTSTPAYMNKPASSGILGRPKVSDDSKKMLGAKIAAKFARGAADYTEEEIAYIKDLYNSIK